MDNTIVISTPPHVKSPRTTKSIMLDVLIALLPAAVMGIVYFGLTALLAEVVCVLSAVATEFAYFFIAEGGFKDKCKNAKEIARLWLKRFDFTSVITGLILALILPSTVKWYEALIGSVFAVAVVKMLFGGTGKNLVNPAATGRVFMFIGFSITTFAACNVGAISACEIYTGATPLSGYILQGNGTPLSALDLFLGTDGAGCTGETCKLAILAGYIYLVVRKVIKWWQPVVYVLAAGVVGLLLLSVTYERFAIDLLLPYLLSGGLLFGGVFMVTDYVTSPKGATGQLVYYVILGVGTALLRHFTKLEVVSFVIMLGNLIVPHIDAYIVRKPFGYKKEAK